MSIRLMELVFANTELKETRRLAMLALANNASDEGYCWPRISTIQQSVNLQSARSTTRLLKTLEDEGYIERIARYRSNGSQQSNGYQLNITKLTSEVVSSAQGAVPGDRGGCPGGQGGDDTGDRGGMTAGTPLEPLIEPLKEPSLKNTRTAEQRVPENSKNKPSEKGNLSDGAPSGAVQNRVREFVARYICEKTGLEYPDPRTPAQKKSAGVLWWAPSRQIAEMAEWSEENAAILIDECLKRLDGLTVASAKSLLSTAQAIKAEVKRGAFRSRSAGAAAGVLAAMAEEGLLDG